MQFKNWGWKPCARTMIICCVVLTVLFGLLGVAVPASAKSVSGDGGSFGGPNAGLPDQIMLSWVEDPATTQTIAWRTGADTTQEKVQYLPAADFDGSFDAAIEVTAAKSELYAGHSHFEITLRELVPDTSYIYRVGREGAWSEPAAFSTAGPGHRFSFLYMGDVQGGYEDWGELVQGAVAENPGVKFALLGGDLVNDGNSIDEWQRFFAAATPVFRQIPLIPAVGNHDDKPIFWDSFALPQNGPEGFEEKFYSFDYGNCHIAVLNSNLMGASSPHYETLRAWLQDDLNNSRQQWKFLVFHYPPYPVVDDGHSYNLQENWVPLFEQCDVDLVFVGHQHVYMRTFPLRGGEIQEDGEGIVYIMGNSGTKFYPAGPGYDYIAKELDYVSNYQVIDIDGDDFVLTARDADGRVIDSYSVRKLPVGDGVYIITPVADAAYQKGTTAEGIKTMTVNSGVSGMRFFSIEVTPVRPHDGLESVVFVHLRDGIQDSINVTRADFDMVENAQAGFNVEPGDLIEVYIVDDLTNAVDFNPTILQ